MPAPGGTVRSDQVMCEGTRIGLIYVRLSTVHSDEIRTVFFTDTKGGTHSVLGEHPEWLLKMATDAGII